MPNMRATELRDTAPMMESADYKERFKAEYIQVVIRANKLHNMIERHKDGTLSFTPTCPIGLLEEQLNSMGDYIRCLQRRAELEGISL